MANLTENQKIVINKGVDVSLETGYDLVIVDDDQYKLYREGYLPEKKGWMSFKKSKVSSVYAVSTDDRHEVSFKKPVAHSDGIHNFFVNITIRFGVSDPIQVTKTLRRDPVARLKEETGAVIVGFLRSSTWSDIQDSNRFAQLRSGALDQYISTGRGEVVPMFDRISEHANNYGLKLSEINFDVVIAEEDLIVEIKKEEFDREKSISNAETDKDIHVNKNQHEVRKQGKTYEGELRDFDRREELKNQATTTTANYLDKVGKTLADNTRNLDDVKGMLSEALEIQGMIQSGASNSSTYQSSNSLGGGNVARLKAGSSLVHSFLDLVTEIKKADLEIETQKTLLGSLFKMLGAKLLDESDEAITDYLTPLSEIEIQSDLQEFIMEKLKDMKIKVKNNQIL